MTDRHGGGPPGAFACTAPELRERRVAVMLLPLCGGKKLSLRRVIPHLELN